MNEKKIAENNLQKIICIEDHQMEHKYQFCANHPSYKEAEMLLSPDQLDFFKGSNFLDLTVVEQTHAHRK